MKTETKLKLEELHLAISEAKKKMLKESNAIFNTVAKELFETHEQLEEFSWTQYTPYWSDGETCYFNVNDAMINGEEGISDWEVKDARKNKESQEKIAVLENLVEITSDVQELLDSIGEECLEEMFGDHAQITVTKDSVVVDSFDHD
jgi:hypothetical protein